LSSPQIFYVSILSMGSYQLFHCPNCNAGLDLSENGAAIIRCDYCHSVVIVPESLRHRVKGIVEEKTAPKKRTQPAKPKLTEEQAAAMVTALARSGQQIEAMKLYRETYPVGLKETKQAIEQAAAGLPLPVPERRWSDEGELPVEAAEEITHLAALGRLEGAASLYRVTFGTSHVEARAAVQQLVEGNSIDVARHKARTASQATAVRLTNSGGVPSQSSMLPGAAVLLALFFIVAVAIGLVLIFAF
jgi:hypothetical protein